MGDTPVLDAVFVQRLARFICYDPATRKHDPARAKILTDNLGISVKNLRRWATGADCPPPMKKKEMVEFLDSWQEQP